MTGSAERASFNLATLSIAEREAIENQKQEMFLKWKQAKDHASVIYSGLRAGKSRAWAESELSKRPDIDKETREQLNKLLKVKK